MKKLLSLLLAALLFAACAFAEGDALPAFEYRGPDPIAEAVCAYLLENEGGYYTEGDVLIPCPSILEVDDTDPQDTLVWADYYLNWYVLRNTTLICVSGGAFPGMMHLRATDDGWEVTSVEYLRDGEDYDVDAKRVFGAREGLLEKFEADDDEALAIVERQYVSDYVNWNGLNVTQLQHFGWPPVPLINAPDTAEADQIIHCERSMGCALDYDLRVFSEFDYDDESISLAGVGDLEGISIDVYRYDESAEAILAELSEDMTEPVQTPATLGAEDVACTRLEDAALGEGVARPIYVVPLEGGCLAISTCNTFYYYEGDPVVPGGDAALEKVLSTFRLVP